MNEQTPTLVEPYFSIRHKPIFYSPHPSYVGAYPNTVTRAEARFQLGLSPTANVFLCFGAILPYKGFDFVVSEAEGLAKERPELDWQVLIAGAPLDPAFEKRIENTNLGDRLIIHQRRVPVVDVEYYFNSADYCILPYRQSLNSGAAHLAMSFGVPVVVPAIPAFSEILQHSAGISYEPANVGALAAALARAVSAERTAMHRNALAFARSRRAEAASADFFRGLNEGLAALAS